MQLAVQETLYRMLEGTTIIAILLWVSGIARLGRNLALGRGHVSENRGHEVLLIGAGPYACSWQRSGGFIGAEDGEVMA